MTCQIKGIANLVDTADIRNRLLGFDNQKFDHVPANELPLQSSFVSLSPAGDILALAWNTRLVILASKWDSQEPGDMKKKFHVVWDGDVTSEQDEWITSVICLPLISLGKTSSGLDWTSIAVGMNTGFLKFYTETGVFLFEEQLHNEAIVNLKCQSLSASKQSGDCGSSEEIYVLYNTAICVLQGFSLFSTIRAYRNHLARVKANCNDRAPGVNLACKKWSFKNQDLVDDSEVIGSTYVNTFDHLMTASICGGYNANYRSSAPQHTLVMATGKRPFIGFHYALEGGAAPVLSDVAMAMASKVASAIGAAVPWFRSSSKPPSTPEKIKTLISEPPEPMTCRFGLSDARREGECIIVSPNKVLSIVCDAMGRVILMDNKQGIAIRMWKGYRDAQCGWIEAVEDTQRVSHRSHHSRSVKSSTPQHPKRTALFLVIYAPKKGIIDIWGIQHGIKIATFSASRSGRLLYTSYGLCGLNDFTINSANRAQHSCIFIDPLGGIREIMVPFHYALSSQNSNRARDMHLLKKLRTFLKEEDFAEDKLINEITNTCLDMKTNEIRLHLIEMLMVNRHITPDALLAAAGCFSKQLEVDEEENPESSIKALTLTIYQLKNVIHFFKYIRAQYDQPPEYNTVASDEIPDGKYLSTILFASEREVHRILKLSKMLTNLKRPSGKIQTRVTFQEDGKTFLDFLSCFDFGSPGALALHKNVTYDKKCQIAKLIFQGWMYSNDPISRWQEHALNSDISPKVLMQFALIYWLIKKTGAPLEIELVNFTKLLNAICSLNVAEEVYGSYNEISQWWKDVRNILMDSTNSFSALTAAMACRAISITIQRKKDRLLPSFKDDNGNEKEDEANGNQVEKAEKVVDKEDRTSLSEEETVNNTSDWENVSKDTCQFSFLIGCLEDVSVLDAIVSNPPEIDDTTKFYSLPYESPHISLGIILSRGKGSVSEIIAKWLASTGVDPARLIDTTDIEFDQLQLSVDSLKLAGSLEEAKAVEMLQEDSKALLSVSVEIGEEAKSSQNSLEIVLERLSLLKRHFPYSLTSSVLLANLAWEFIVSWNKDISKLRDLEAGLCVIRQIPSKRVRHGVCCLLWSLHVKKRMENAGKLMNKMGKLPKERLCMQDVGLSDIQLTSFLQHCVAFLDIFIDSEILEEESCSFIRSEELWEGHSGGPQPFAMLAITQSPAWYDLLLLHLQLANVLHMIAYFNLKISKPITNLFDSVAHQYFFQDISNRVMVPWYKDEKRDNCRTDFLCRVITASMESIHQETTEADGLSSSQAILWMSKCQNLASMWKINNDELRIHQVCQMYINGFDRLAEEVYIAVNDTEKLAANLLPIAGGRMMASLVKAPNLLEEVSRISPTLTTYLQSLEWDSPSFVLTNCSNDDTAELVRKVSRNLPESHNEYHIAQLMLDALFIYQKETSQSTNR